MTIEQMRNKLDKFSKSQIIDVIIKKHPYQCNVERLIEDLEYLHDNELIKKHSDSIDEERKATHEYIKWQDEMIAKYGSNRKVRLVDIPNDELLRGADLESKMKAARKKERKLNEKVHDILRR